MDFWSSSLASEPLYPINRLISILSFLLTIACATGVLARTAKPLSCHLNLFRVYAGNVIRNKGRDRPITEKGKWIGQQDASDCTQLKLYLIGAQTSACV